MDIVQSVGRILREKHDKPLVVDIVDGHDVFKNQWAKRRRYYKKCEYTIKSINSVKYGGFGDMDSWKLVYRSAASIQKTAKCVVNLEDSDKERGEQESQGTDSDDDGEEDDGDEATNQGEQCRR